MYSFWQDDDEGDDDDDDDDVQTKGNTSQFLGRGKRTAILDSKLRVRLSYISIGFLGVILESDFLVILGILGNPCSVAVL